LPPADGANHAQDIEFTIGASAMQQRSVGRHKQRRRIHQTLASCLQKNLSMEERRALYSVIRPEMEAMGYLKLFD
jgi:hypothetical protein